MCMNNEILRKIGLTEGEIRVYGAIVKLGKTSTGPIIDQSQISSSKAYIILEKLIQKGFVTYLIENNVKKFTATNPVNIIEYLTEQQEELEKTKKEAQELVKELTKTMSSYEEENVKIYKGTKSMRSAFQNILDELKKNEKFLFIGAPLIDIDKLQLFFQNIHAKREQKKIKTLGIVDISTKTEYHKIFEGRKDIELKIVKLPFPHAVGIGTNRIIISLWEPTPIGFEINSKRMTQRYRNFFYRIWNNK